MDSKQKSISLVNGDSDDDDDATVINYHPQFTKVSSGTFKETKFEELLGQPHETLTYTVEQTSAHNLIVESANNSQSSSTNMNMIGNQQQKSGSGVQNLKQGLGAINLKKTNSDCKQQSGNSNRQKGTNSSNMANSKKPEDNSKLARGRSSNMSNYNQNASKAGSLRLPSKVQISKVNSGKSSNDKPNPLNINQKQPNNVNLKQPSMIQGQKQQEGAKVKPIMQSAIQNNQIIDDTCFLHMNGGLVFIKHNNKDVIVHQKIFQQFGQDCIEKIANNQTLVFGDSKTLKTNNLVTEQEIVEFLKVSANFKHIENIEKIAEGGEAIVYKINYAGFEEVVLKIPKQKKPSNSISTMQANQANIEGFEDLICESQLIKSIYHPDYTVEVKEEIIEIDINTKKLIRYCVIVERARYSLYDLYAFRASAKEKGKIERTGLWFNPTNSRQNLERFSVSKFFYYFYETAQAIDYLHSQGIIYSDLKPQNLLVMRNQKIKIGDFGVSILTRKGKDKYRMKGLSPQWCAPEIRESFNQCLQKRQISKFYQTEWDQNQLKMNDIYALVLTFSVELIGFLIPSNSLSEEDQKYVTYFGDIGIQMALKRSLTLQDALQQIARFIHSEMNFLYNLLQILKDEKKYEAAYEIGKMMKTKAQFQDGISEETKSLFYARIYKIMGEFLYYQGNYKEAIEDLMMTDKHVALYEPVAKSTEIREQLQCLKFENTINQAKVLLNLGHLKEAEETLNNSLTQYNSTLTLQKYIQYNLMLLDLQGLVEMLKGNINKAKSYFEEYLSVMEKLDSSSAESDSIFIQSNKITSLMKLGDILYKQRQYSDSLIYYQKVQGLLHQEHGENHPMTLDCLKSIGNIHLQIDQLEEANVCFNHALSICQTIFGEKNVQTAETYRQIGDLFNKKRSAKGVFYYDKAKSIYDSLYGPDNFHCAVLFNNLGGLYEQLGELERAEEMCLKALAIKQQMMHGQESLDFASIYSNLCQIKLKQKKAEEGLRYIQKAYDIRFKIQGVDNLETHHVLLQYARLLAVFSKLPEAISLCQNAYDLSLNKYSEDSQCMLLMLQFIGQCQLKACLVDQAQPNLLKCLTLIRKQGFNETIPEVEYELLKDIGMTYESKGDIKAIQYYLQAIKLCKNPAEKFGMYRSLAILKARAQDLTEALDYLEKAEEILTQNSSQGGMFQELESKFGGQIREMLAKLREAIVQKNKQIIGGATGDSQ